MKKIVAIVLALVMAFGCTAIAFADCKCPYCGANFTDEDLYNDHINICYSQFNIANSKKEANGNFANITLKDILTRLVDAFSVNVDWINAVSGIITRLIDLIENIGTAAVGQADVAGAIDDLEAKVADLPIVGDVLEYIHNLINTLKQKVKDLYAHDAETAAVAPVETGSTSVGIAAFAAVSVAAAAAFVCTKKKED